jgi:FkbM family methyltransferase
MLIRRLLLGLLGFRNYLHLISRVFLQLYFWRIRLGAHRQVAFLQALVRPGDACLDIGANLGYFTLPLAKLAGPQGKVYAVEPVADFREVLQANLRRFGGEQVEVFPYALGGDDGRKVWMGTPKVDGVVRHGRTEVLEGDTPAEGIAHRHEATMRTPSSLFGHLPRLDFVKCDVEGYELHIVPHLVPLIQRFRPIVEIEIDPLEHKRQLIGLFRELGYRPYLLQGDRLAPFLLGKPAHQREIELYFLHDQHQARLSHLLA